MSLTSFAISEKLNLTMTKKKKRAKKLNWKREEEREDFSNIHSTWKRFFTGLSTPSLCLKPYQSNESSSKLVYLLFATLTKRLFVPKFFNFLLKFSKFLVDNKGSSSTYHQFWLSFTRSEDGKQYKKIGYGYYVIKGIYVINVEVRIILSIWPLKWPPTTSKANKLKLSLFVGYIVHVRLFGIPE